MQTKGDTGLCGEGCTRVIGTTLYLYMWQKKCTHRNLSILFLFFDETRKSILTQEISGSVLLACTLYSFSKCPHSACLYLLLLLRSVAKEVAQNLICWLCVCGIYVLSKQLAPCICRLCTYKFKQLQIKIFKNYIHTEHVPIFVLLLFPKQ